MTPFEIRAKAHRLLANGWREAEPLIELLVALADRVALLESRAQTANIERVTRPRPPKRVESPGNRE